MPESPRILAIDQGTTSTRAIVFDGDARPVGSEQVELSQHFPQPGWVEHDPLEILDSALDMSKAAVAKAGIGMQDLTCVGVTNQRETTLLWERDSGRPLANAIVWRDRRTSEVCKGLELRGLGEEVRQITGLVLDPYFSATKLRWLLDAVPDGQRRAEDGEICFGTVDSWLIYRLTGGASHVTDVTNASRTMLLNLHDLQWDPEMLSLFDIPRQMLPEVLPSAADFGVTSGDVLGAEAPITGVAGDQHAALYGQACFEPGMTKCTYGTGAFVLTNTGSRVAGSKEGGLLATMGFQVGSKRVYALEGSVFSTGATVQWLRDGLGVIEHAIDTELLVMETSGNDGVYLVPAFAGLGAPHWDASARGVIVGLTLGTGKAHIARAALESTAYQVKDVIDVMDNVAGRRRTNRPLRADGGQTANGFLMQFQADILDRPVEVAAVQETTALGAAFLAGRGAGVWRSDAEIAGLWQAAETYEPRMGDGERLRLHAGWLNAVRKAMTL
ncbi:MAG: glycerol kinase GlpK [Chloroflexi bacterium]|nr:glycerol kinase GlpK [Chloroflexota bacterium]MDA1297661.1 glycerol kinase GlpK [Chloroflexota bacterium]